jgi:transcription initiation factor IIE alpha subunit
MVKYMQTSKYNTTYKESQGQKQMVISIDTEKVFNKIQHLFKIKALKKLKNIIEIMSEHNKGHIYTTDL